MMILTRCSLEEHGYGEGGDGVTSEESSDEWNFQVSVSVEFGNFTANNIIGQHNDTFSNLYTLGTVASDIIKMFVEGEVQ